MRIFKRHGIGLKNMTDQSIQTSADLRSAIESALSDGITQTALAKQCGLSAPTVNQWLKSSYLGNNEAVESKLSAWLQSRKVADAIVNACGPQWVQTPTGAKMEKTLSYAHHRPGIALIAGSSGMGKTTTIDRYVKTYPNVWKVKVCPSNASMRAMLLEISSVLDLHGNGWQNRSLARDINQSLKGTNGLLVIDEAQLLGVQAIEEIRSIFDESKVGLVFAGNHKVYSIFSKGIKNSDFSQISSRVGRKLAIHFPTTEDVDAILDAWEVTGTKEREYAQEIATRPGAIRTLVNILEDATAVAQGMDKPLDLRMMRMAWAEFGGAS